MTTADAPKQVEDELVQQELDRAEKKKRTGRTRIVGGVVSVVIIGVVFAYLLPKIADYAQVWDVVTTLSWEWIVALIAVTIVNLLSSALPWMAALPGLGFLHALRVTSASSALSLVAPGGTAVGDGDAVRDAEELGHRGTARRPRGSVDEHLGPARYLRLPDPGGRSADRGRRRATRRSTGWR